MARTRLDFQNMLESLTGDKRIFENKPNVYHRPPHSMHMNYPAIVYKLANIVNTHADNFAYHQANAYDVTYITKMADDPMVQKISELPMCTFNRFYTADNLDHYNFTIYF